MQAQKEKLFLDNSQKTQPTRPVKHPTSTCTDPRRSLRPKIQNKSQLTTAHKSEIPPSTSNVGPSPGHGHKYYKLLINMLMAGSKPLSPVPERSSQGSYIPCRPKAVLKKHTPSKEIKLSWLESKEIHPKNRPFVNKTVEYHGKKLCTDWTRMCPTLHKWKILFSSL